MIYNQRNADDDPRIQYKLHLLNTLSLHLTFFFIIKTTLNTYLWINIY